MPKYRKLHTKIVDSIDFNEMPSETCRLFWVLLPTQLDREGRGLNNLSWLKSKVFPLREDLSLDDIAEIMWWLVNRKMIIEYCVGDRDYFFVPTFIEYQGDTHKEAESNFPAPVYDPPSKLLETGSRLTPEEVKAEVAATPEPVNMAESEIDSFLKHWETLFPDKAQPRRKTITDKFKTRIKEKYFYDNWLKALGRAAKSNYLKDESWFTALWFLKNDENWEKCLDGNYDGSKSPHQKKVDQNRKVIKRVAQEYVDDEL